MPIHGGTEALSMRLRALASNAPIHNAPPDEVLYSVSGHAQAFHSDAALAREVQRRSSPSRSLEARDDARRGTC
jgi:hypothetical protein